MFEIFFLKAVAMVILTFPTICKSPNKFHDFKIILLFMIPYFMLSCCLKRVRNFQDLFEQNFRIFVNKKGLSELTQSSNLK